MTHGRGGAVLLFPGQEQQPVKLRLLPGKADVLLPHAQERDVRLQARVGVAVIHVHCGGIDRRFDAAHGAERGKDRLRGRAQLVPDVLGGQPSGALGPHYPQRRLHHFRFREFVLRSHCLHLSRRE